MKQTADEVEKQSWGSWAKSLMTKENAVKAGALGLAGMGVAAMAYPQNRATLRVGLRTLGRQAIIDPEQHGARMLVPGSASLRDRWDAAWRAEHRLPRS